MKDKLEEFVRNHREEFDVYHPGKEVWEKIADPSPAEKKPVKRWLRYTWRAAGIVIIFCLSFLFHELWDIRKEQQARAMEESIYEMVPELKDAEYYYNNLVDSKLEELKPFFSDFPGLESEVKKDIDELDSVYVSLKSDLKDNVANDEVIEAMIQNYRLKIQILEDLLYEFKDEDDEPTELRRM